MAKALHKVQKHISKKRGGKPTSLHENSRDSQRLRAAGARDDKLAKVLAAATRANQAYGQPRNALLSVAPLKWAYDSGEDCFLPVCTSSDDWIDYRR